MKIKFSDLQYLPLLLILPFIYFISILPFRLLYIFSDILYVIIYSLFSYRKKVVVDNLKRSFPEKSDIEILQLTKKFYHYFCDLILETLKTLTISKSQLKRHVAFDNTALFKKYVEEHKSVIIVMGHWGNWELAGARFGIEGLHSLYVIYHPLSNRFFEKLIYHMRTRLGNNLYPMKDALRGMINDRDKLTATAFIADQSPSLKGAHWLTFMNQDTPVFMGTEKIARKMNYPVIYVSVKRIQRGFYSIDYELLTDNPKSEPEYTITAKHTERLEKDIFAQPEIWLWTHRRWKHKRPG